MIVSGMITLLTMAKFKPPRLQVTVRDQVSDLTDPKVEWGERGENGPDKHRPEALKQALN